MKLIKLHGKWGEGKFTMVDDWRYDELNQYRWHLTAKGYVERKITINGKSIHIQMHRIVNRTPNGKITAHLDQNPLNNQETNLRIANHSTNGANKPKPFGAGLYLGVTQSGNKYRAQIWKDNQRYDLGTFPNERWAAMARDIAAQDLYGEFTYPNFTSDEKVSWS